MRVVADLQLHSKYAIATSKDMDLEHLAAGARIKGLGLLGTGDFTHPKWYGELKSKLQPVEGTGLFTYSGMTWMLSGEVSTVYEQAGKVRKVHHLLYAPDLETVSQMNSFLSRYARLASDGRPVLTGIDSAELVEALTGISGSVVVVPAHVWTPWFSVFGSRSGFDTLEECYQDQARKIFAIETGLSCYDAATEVLTESGWKKFSEVSEEDGICTLNPASAEIEFQKPNSLTRSHYRGKMYRLKTKRVDLLVTPNHKLFVTQYGSRGPKPFKLAEASQLFGKSKVFSKDGTWAGEEFEYFELPAVRAKHGSRFYSGEREIAPRKLPIRPWMEFFGLWIAEGHASKGNDGDYNVVLSNSDEVLASRMTQVFKELGYRPLLSETQPGCYQIRVRNFQLYQYLKVFGHSHEKFIPLEIKKLSRELLTVFLSGYLKGDGHVYGRTGKGLSATTSSTRLRDDLQEIALKVGLSAYYKAGDPKGTPIKSLHNGKYKSAHDTWVVYFIRHNRHGVTPSVLKKRGYLERWVDYDGLVYCASVPNHVMYVRRNGIPVWCGNSDPAMNWRISSLDRLALVSNSDAHSPNPWRLGREANVFDLRRLTYRGIFDAVRRKDRSKFLFTIEVDPSYGKYHFTGHKKCGVSIPPDEAKRLGNVCPKCGRRLTVGVLQRVEGLADRPDGYVPPDVIPFKRLLPLYEVISFATGVNRLYAKRVLEMQDKLISAFGNELTVILDAEEKEIARVAPEKVTKAIIASREGRVRVVPGYDGMYGVPTFME